MSMPKSYRPAWKGMGWWRWLSIILISYSLVMIIPYVLFGGGSHAIQGTAIELDLADCRIQLGANITKNTVGITAKIDPACSPLIEPPTVELLDALGSVVAANRLRGNPNMLSANLKFDSTLEAPVILVLATKNQAGLTFRQRWPLADLQQ